MGFQNQNQRKDHPRFQKGIPKVDFLLSLELGFGGIDGLALMAKFWDWSGGDSTIWTPSCLEDDSSSSLGSVHHECRCKECIQGFYQE
jgi:hypothetical protein